MGLFSGLFGKQKKPPQVNTVAILDNEQDISRLFGGASNPYANDIIRSCIWANAKNAGKLHPRHIRRTGEKYEEFPQPRIQRLLERPNPLMGMSVFINKMVANMEERNNSFALIKADGLYPITYTSAEAIPAAGEYFIKFTLPDGKNLTVPYVELIHLRKHFSRKDLFGEDNTPLNMLTDIVKTTDTGVIAAVKNSAVIRWLLKFNSVLKPEDRQAQIDDFVKNFLGVANTGGAAAADPRYDAVQVQPNNFLPNAAQMDRTKERIFYYFGVNEKVLKSDFNDASWNAYYESVLEPIAIQLSEECTEKLLTQGERNAGNIIIFEANKMQFLSNASKVSVATFLTNIGALTLDQVLEIFNYAPIGGEDGKRRVQTLNAINAQLADKYQTGNNKEDGNKDVKPDDSEQ